MTIPINSPNLQDDRWGGYIPWFLRHPEFAILGRFDIFFSRVAHRLKQVVNRGEAGMPNITDLGDTIEADSHQCFRHNSVKPLAAQIESYFAPAQIASEAEELTNGDPSVVKASLHYTALLTQMGEKNEYRDPRFPDSELLKAATIRSTPEAKAAAGARDQIHSAQREAHYKALVLKRLTVLESVLRLVKATHAFPPLRENLRRYLAEAQIMLDIKEVDGRILPMEETLLQKEVIDRLLPRLSVRFPRQEKDLVRAYHDLVQGVDADAIFVLAMKALEEIARQVSGRPNLTLETDKDIKAAFPALHPTIYTTITKLAAHRGDKGAHGGQGPPPHEMRYLLFSICNVTLLFLDYPSPTQQAES